MSFAQRAAGWGIVIYAIMQLVQKGLIAYGIPGGLFALTLQVLALAAVAFVATRSLRLVSRMDILPYSAAWALAAVILDGIFLVPLAGWGIYMTVSVWLGYALVALIPFLAFPFVRRSARAH